MARPVILDVCCGAGGLSLGAREALREAGRETEFSFVGIDTERHCVARYQGAFGEAHALNIKETAEVLRALAGRRVAMLIGGPPCQPFSAASSHRKHVHDERNAIGAFVELARVLTPDAIVMEEVPTVAKHYRALLETQILEPLHQMGYATDAQVYDMSWHGGGRVPQARRRLVVRAVRRNISETFPEVRRDAKRCVLREEDFCVIPGEQADAQKLTVERSLLERIARVEAPKWRHSTHDLKIGKPCMTITCSDQQNSSFLLRVGFDRATGRPRNYEGRLDPSLPRRRLTFGELERFQGLPEGWTDGFRVTARRKMIGNAVPPPFAQSVVRTVLGFVV